MLRFALSAAAAAGRAAVVRGAASASAAVRSGGWQCAAARPQFAAPARAFGVQARVAAGPAAPAAATGPPGAAASGPRDRAVGVWLATVSGSVFGMVVLGGVTRLTQSGLSMTSWTFVGSLPPMNEAEWEAEFARYKQFPEYQDLNRGMTLAGFKQIFWWEYSHRMAGRAIGVVFGVPFAYFLARGRFDGAMKRRLAALFALGGAQGLLGWYMVQSGLSRETIVTATPSVSPYRLASHLAMAFGIYGLSLYTALDFLRRKVPLATPLHPSVAKMRRMTVVTLAMLACTILSGAFVAGNDAGMIYNTFPLMGGRVVPSDYIDPDKPLGRNFFENPANVQFNHRVLGVGTGLHILFAVYVAGKKRHFAHLPRPAVTAATALAAVAVAQMSLGIATVLTAVEVPVAAAHQAGSLTLLTACVFLLHALF